MNKIKYILILIVVKSVWILKCKSLTRKQFLDDLEIDEEGIGDMLLDENSVNMLARPGTSL
jgi:tetratricopeptide repeat protein 8